MVKYSSSVPNCSHCDQRRRRFVAGNENDKIEIKVFKSNLALYGNKFV
jgi:hypothetical protein